MSEFFPPSESEPAPQQLDKVKIVRQLQRQGFAIELKDIEHSDDDEVRGVIDRLAIGHGIDPPALYGDLDISYERTDDIE